jgi:metallo-beta-lactamase family protein
VGIIASFAVARGQLLLALISQYFTEHPDQKIRVVIDSPMMVLANRVYKEFADKTRCPLLVKDVLSEVEVIDQEREWTSIQKKDGPLIILSSSGMVSGGRIWRYLENWQQDRNALLFLPGYQGKGTPGRALAEGKKVIFDADGKKIHWHGEVMTSEAFSSHADQSELMDWLKNIKKETLIYLNHGEDEAKEDFKKHLNENGYKNVFIANEEVLELSD